MNEQVREYLIAVARQENETVFYGELNTDNSLKFDLGTQAGQEQLKKLLIEISTYEHQHNRPMLTALAINKKDNDQGAGFYKLAESFGRGKNSELRKKSWGLDEAERVRKYWQNEKNFEQYASLKKNKPTLKTIEKLFNDLVYSPDYQWAKGWHATYVTFVLEVRKLQHALRKNPVLPIDDRSLYQTLSTPIQSYEDFMGKWLKEASNGISSRGQSVLSEVNFNTIIKDSAFKVLAKVVITNPTAASYNLLSDWWRNNAAIRNLPLLINRAVAACAPEILSSTVHDVKFWYVVDVMRTKYGFEFSSDHAGNWFVANEQLTAWLDQKLKTALIKKSTDSLEQQIWRNIFVWLLYEHYHGKPVIQSNELIRRDPPENGFNEMPTREPSFEGYDVDFEKKGKVQKDLGDAGEELVKQHELKKLLAAGLNKLSVQVRIAKPNEGYDVYSFDENGNEKFIEVKTTTTRALNRFYLTRHEIDFMRLNKGHYSLYRVYNFDEENNSGEFFELEGDVEAQLIKDPTQYEVLLKKRT